VATNLILYIISTRSIGNYRTFLGVIGFPIGIIFPLEDAITTLKPVGFYGHVLEREFSFPAGIYYIISQYMYYSWNSKVSTIFFSFYEIDCDCTEGQSNIQTQIAKDILNF
jgi:hypothetical protein